MLVMASLKNLTEKQLDTMLVNTKAEIARRENAQAAAAEIIKILKKYKLSINDVDLQPLSKKAQAKTTIKAKKLASAADKENA